VLFFVSTGDLQDTTLLTPLVDAFGDNAMYYLAGPAGCQLPHKNMRWLYQGPEYLRVCDERLWGFSQKGNFILGRIYLDRFQMDPTLSSLQKIREVVLQAKDFMHINRANGYLIGDSKSFALNDNWRSLCGQ
jgi:hypothetical protein